MKSTVMIVILTICCTALAQEQSAPPAANPADVKSVESIVAAVYDTISGPAGQRNWSRLRSLFVAGARMMPIGPRPQGGFAVRMVSVEEYISRSDAVFQKEGFFESEVNHRVEQWGHMAHVFSTSESRHGRGEKPFLRGVNSIQLVNDGQRWWIVGILWENERADQ